MVVLENSFIVVRNAGTSCPKIEKWNHSRTPKTAKLFYKHGMIAPVTVHFPWHPLKRI
jgi:hypothetical protein